MSSGKTWTARCYSVTGSTVRPEDVSDCKWVFSHSDPLVVVDASKTHSDSCSFVEAHLAVLKTRTWGTLLE